MSSRVQIHPDILNIPYGDRKRIIDACRGKEGLANLASGCPDMPVPAFIMERIRAGLDSGYAPYTNYYGLPELREKLRELPQLVQRIAVKYHLVPLTLEETLQYVEYRLAVAGNLHDEVFTAAALKAIYEHSQGTPRVINNLCDLALAEGAMERVSVIDEELVASIVESETAGGTFEW